jgi:OmpA-OmpF porin, OOP family
MKHTARILIVAASTIALGGCSSLANKPGHSNPVCTLLGALGGGASAAALSSGGGPVGAGIVLGAALGHMACKSPPAPVAPVTPPLAAVVPPSPTPPAAVELDSDGDGVVDRLDRCPGTPIGTPVDANGCPEILLTLTGVNFEFDSARIDPSSVQILNHAVDVLNKASPIAVRIEGHTDSVGSDAYNLALSNRRATAVRDYLVKHGVAADRLTVEGKGESQPVVANDTAENRYQNRRVEFHVDDSGAMWIPGDTSGADTSVAEWRRLDQPIMRY